MPRSAFQFYLRTGRLLSADDSLELKFNPWHDPRNGEFTFAGQGSYFGGRGASASQPGSGVYGGGSFGGGGAGGSWAPTRAAPSRPFRPGGGRGGAGGAGGSWAQPNEPSPLKMPSRAAQAKPPILRIRKPRPGEARVTVSKNGYRYDLDAHVRTRHVSGEIRLQPQPRSRRMQADAGKPDRRSGDDGGHYIAARFNGPQEWFNHFAQDANFNRGAYRVLEEQWAAEVRAGDRVFVDIVPLYQGTSMRPYKLIVYWVVDERTYRREFPNERTER